MHLHEVLRAWRDEVLSSEPEMAIAEGWTVKTIREQGKKNGYQRPKREHGRATNGN